jgi:hypothetical protein
MPEPQRQYDPLQWILRLLEVVDGSAFSESEKALIRIRLLTQLNKEEETMEGKILNFARPAGDGPRDEANYLKNMKPGCVFHAQFRVDDRNVVSAFMFEVAKIYESTALLAQFDPATQSHVVSLYGQERFCRRFELLSVEVEGSDEEQENEQTDSLDGAG